jgi:hypothetical protein
MPVERSRMVLAFVMRIYKLANGHFTWLPCTKSCHGCLSFLMNCCAYVQNPFAFWGEILKFRSVCIIATDDPLMEPRFVIALLGYYEATPLLNMQILEFKELLKDTLLD